MRGWGAGAALGLGLLACGGEAPAAIDFGEVGLGETDSVPEEVERSSTGEEESSGGDEDSEPTLVPLDVEAVAVEGPCTALQDGERVAAVGPNAEAWLARDEENTSMVRVISVRGTSDFGFETSGLLLATSALDGERGAFATAQGLFTVSGPRIDLLAWSGDPAAVVDLCGDLSVDGDGRVLTDDIHTRDLGQWWRWNAPAGVVGHSASMGMQAGACADQSGAGYLLHEGTVWSVRSDFVESLPAFGPASAVVGHDAFGVAAAVDGELRVGDPEQDPAVFSFEAGPVTGLAAGDEQLYIVAGDRVYTMDAGLGFRELLLEGASLGVQTLHGAGAGGVVVQAQDEVCFRGPAKPIEVVGVRPAAHRRLPGLELQLTADVDALQAHLDDAPIELSATPEGWALSVEWLDEGWHTLEVFHDGAARRIDFSVERLTQATWQDDILPLFEAHCANPACHGPNPSSPDRPDLSVYEAWVELSQTLRIRVVQSGDMPPTGLSDWGVEDTLLVLGWLDAGLPEGE